ncbi:integrase/recombinase xerD homolog [Mytilus edulis]|uniref:integrase/recombinase xerD homolog n=1 Tax=Mytilus edulis TaxID=6550 RepID=UPI0039EE1E9B
MDMAKKSKSDSTNKKYDLYFNKFKIWCRKFNLKFLPADVSTVSLYLTELIQSACSVSVLNSNFYAIKWYHELFLYPNPCCSSLSNIVLEGGKRILAKPIQKKEPITADIIVKLFNLYHDISNLSNCRLLCMLSLAYAGFFRYKELSLIRMSDISFHNTHVEIIVHNSKTDIYRQGSIVMIASTDMPTCPVKFLKHYCNLASLKINSSEYIFRCLQSKKDTLELSKLNKPLSYTRAREILLEALCAIGLDKKQFGLHSLRSGGATQAANNGVSDRLFKVHGRWRSENAKDGYVKDSIDKRLSVSKNLGI